MARTGQGANIEIIAKVSTYHVLSFYGLCVREICLALRSILLIILSVASSPRLEQRMADTEMVVVVVSCVFQHLYSLCDCIRNIIFLSFPDLISQSRRGVAESGCVA